MPNAGNNSRDIIKRSVEVREMTNSNFVKGMGVGVAAGIALGMALAPRKRSGKRMAGRAIKAFGEVVDNISHVVGI
jgi:hypothetical protein